MSKGFLALLVFAVTLLVTIKPITASGTPPGPSPNIPPNDLQTRVIQDAEGNLHVLWLVPALNYSASSPGIWYSKYSANGTDAIAPTQITNSTTIQSTDLAVDMRGNAIIIWADDMRPMGRPSSALYLLRFNSTQSQTTQVLTTRGSLILWPSVTVGNSSIFMTWTEYNPANSHAVVEYGTLTSAGLAETETLATYERADAFPPQSRVVFDNSSETLQIAWGESETNGRSASTINYAKLGSNGTLLTKLQVAKLAATLRDVTITATGPRDGAFVVWQTAGSNYSLYVSQISASGELVYVKELNYTTGQSKYLAVSTDLEDNLYVLWYQPSFPTPQTIQSTPTESTNMTYLRMNFDGVIDQNGTGMFRTPIIAVTVLSDGIVYGVSPEGLVKVVVPTQETGNGVTVATIAVMSCISIVGVGSSVLVEEGRYRWVALCSKAVKSTLRSGKGDQKLVGLLARKPGLRLRDIRRLAPEHPLGLASLVSMERGGTLASFRDGLSRRFYVKSTENGPADALRTRILHWVVEHPGIWEAQLAKDLGLSQQAVHYHLMKLREARLVKSHADADGSRKLYRFVEGTDTKGRTEQKNQ